MAVVSRNKMLLQLWSFVVFTAEKQPRNGSLYSSTIFATAVIAIFRTAISAKKKEMSLGGTWRIINLYQLTLITVHDTIEHALWEVVLDHTTDWTYSEYDMIRCVSISYVCLENHHIYHHKCQDCNSSETAGISASPGLLNSSAVDLFCIPLSLFPDFSCQPPERLLDKDLLCQNYCKDLQIQRHDATAFCLQHCLFLSLTIAIARLFFSWGILIPSVSLKNKRKHWMAKW